MKTIFLSTGSAQSTNSFLTQYYSLFMGISLIILLFILFYFFIIPDKKKEKRLEQLQMELKIGDKVDTLCGISGVITELNSEYAILVTGTKKNEVEILRSSITNISS